MNQDPPAAPSHRRRHIVVAGSLVALSFAGIVVAKQVRTTPHVLAPTPVRTTVVEANAVPSSTQEMAPVVPTSTPPIPPVVATSTVAHVPLPSEVRGLYWTASTASGSRADEMIAYTLKYHANAAVIDLKMDDGEIAFTPKDASLAPYAQKHPGIKDLEALLEKLRAKGIYRIARIAIMRDSAFASVHPELSLHRAGGEFWLDRQGMRWLDPAAPLVTETALALGREAYARGFDEVQYDYVRFPTDGTLKTIVYPVYKDKVPRVSVMNSFFENVGGVLRSEYIPVSFDLFGMTFFTTDDFRIGQTLNGSFPYADFVSPMAYPSHYANYFESYRNPALYPYEVVKKTLDKGVETLHTQFVLMKPADARAKFRPWLQDFDLGATYDATKIQAEIKAARDAGASGWMLWNARNVYEPTCYEGKCTGK